MNNLIDYLLNLSTQPAWIFVAIILSSYLLEDLAIISAAILAADQLISVPLAASAIMIGIVSGDIGLYFMGYLARQHAGLRKRITRSERHDLVLNNINTNLLKNILLIRFIPGLRFVCYTSCGLLNIHFWRYVLCVSLATALWVVVVFSIIYSLGSSIWVENSHWKWLLVPVAIAMLYLSNRHFIHRLKAA